MRYAKVYAGLPPAARGVDDGRWFPWYVVMRYPDGRVQTEYFHTEAQADEYLSRRPASTIVRAEDVSWTR